MHGSFRPGVPPLRGSETPTTEAEKRKFLVSRLSALRDEAAELGVVLADSPHRTTIFKISAVLLEARDALISIE